MKTSKIIFITLLSSIALLILLAFIDVRVFGYRTDDKKTSLITNLNQTSHFKVLCINNSSRIRIIQNDSTYIKITLPKDSILAFVNYKIKNDTLTISDTDNLHRPHLYLAFTISVSDSLECIILNKSHVTIDRFVYDKLSFSIDQSTVWFNHNKSNFTNLQISARNKSDVNSTNFIADTLGILLQNSEASLEISAKKISCNLSDSSNVSLRQANEISIKKDQSSKSSVSNN